MRAEQEIGALAKLWSGSILQIFSAIKQSINKGRGLLPLIQIMLMPWFGAETSIVDAVGKVAKAL